VFHYDIYIVQGWLKFWVVQFIFLKSLDSGSLFCVSLWHLYCYSVVFCLNDNCFFMLIYFHGTNCSCWDIRWQEVGNPDPLMGVVCCWVWWWLGVRWIRCGDSPAKLRNTEWLFTVWWCYFTFKDRFVWVTYFVTLL